MAPLSVFGFALLCTSILGLSVGFTFPPQNLHGGASRKTTSIATYDSLRSVPWSCWSRKRIAVSSALSSEAESSEGESDARERPSIHPATIDAITEALELRAENKTKTLPLRLYDDVDSYQIMMTAGRIAQNIVERTRRALDINEEEQQIIGGRVIAIINRLEELEDELVAKASNANFDETEQRNYFGVVNEEVIAANNENENAEVSKNDIDKALDAEIKEDSSLAKRRAESLLALFLELVEGPGLRANNVQVPCMDVDFLEVQRYDAIFNQEASDVDSVDDHQNNMNQLQKELDKIETQEQEEEEQSAPSPPIAKDDKPVKKQIGDPLREANGVRPSLHPLTINIVAEALRIRARNDTSAPLRLINDSTEGWEIHYHAGKVAEKFIRQRQQTSDQDGMTLTDEEEAVVGGRVVGIVMRFEDLEWELVHRCNQVPWIGKYNEWANFGILKDESCIKSLDERILSDPLFTVNRAERLLALFLLNLEGPGVKAAGDSLPGGSDVDFLDEDHYQIMAPQTEAA